ncbi:MAG: chorismate synthase [Candidatus Ancaeobacter aquaticus]|nr:chorismate synthase [Candidatus Ancaeobacter aquaticus]
MLRFLTAGESHGECLSAILEGLPAGLKIDVKKINVDLARRQSGYGRGGRMAIEKDTVKIVSGLRKGVTIGSPIAILVKNKDFKINELPKVTHPRPGHADLVGALKYNRSDVRDILERASARETAARTGVGALCKQLLEEFKIILLSHVVEIGGVKASTHHLNYAKIEKAKAKSQLNCADPVIEKRIISSIERAKEEKNTLGGVFEVIIRNVPPGLGSYIQWNKRLGARLSYALMGIQAIKGVEIGLGFDCARKLGSDVHDEMFLSGKNLLNVKRKTNNAGGIEGGMSNGEDIVIRAAMKPIATVMEPLQSVDIKTKKKCCAATERSDICAVPAASVVGEAMCAFVIAEALLEKFGGDSMDEVSRNYKSYVGQVKKF